MSDSIKIAIFGAGAIGSAVYHLLRDRTAYSVTVADMRPYNDLRPGAIAQEHYQQLDTRHPGANNNMLTMFVSDKTLVINALPYTENLVIYNACLKSDIPYFDFSEDAELNDFINNPAPTSRHTTVKVFLMSLFPFKLDKWAPKYPPVKDPKIRITNKSLGK